MVSPVLGNRGSAMPEVYDCLTNGGGALFTKKTKVNEHPGAGRSPDESGYGAQPPAALAAALSRSMTALSRSMISSSVSRRALLRRTFPEALSRRAGAGGLFLESTRLRAPLVSC